MEVNIENLKKLRIQSGYTNELMAKVIGVENCTYHKKERGELKVSLSDAKKIADFFKCSIEDVFFPQAGA